MTAATQCWCGGHIVETATPGVFRCASCGEITNEWEDDDASEE